MPKKNHDSASTEEAHPIDPKTGRPKTPPRDRTPKRAKATQGTDQHNGDLATRLTGLPVIGTMVSALLRLPPAAQIALWLVACGVFAWAMVELLVAQMPTIIGYTEENILIMFSASVLIVTIAPILATRNWRHLMRPAAVTALCWVTYPEVMPMVLFIGLIRIYLGEIASTSLWPSPRVRDEDPAAKKQR